MNNLSQRKVAYWSIDTPITDYGILSTPTISPEESVTAATMRTRLNAFASQEIDLHLKAGYAGATASLLAKDLGVFGREPVSMLFVCAAVRAGSD